LYGILSIGAPVKWVLDTTSFERLSEDIPVEHQMPGSLKHF
jgi:hypothetical protein